MRSTTAPYTESRLAHLVRNKCEGFPVVEQTHKAIPDAVNGSNFGKTGIGSYKGFINEKKKYF